MLSAAQVSQLVNQRAPAYNLDALAVLSVAAQEGLHNTVPGDGGTSFGPWQLHAGGALPASIWAQGPNAAQAWAWSAEGVEYALQQMSGVAAGMRGSAAIQNLVNKFERPREDLRAGEISRATALYQQGGGGMATTDDIGAPGGLPDLQGGGGIGAGGLPDISAGGLPAGATLPGAQATDPEGYSINPTTLARHVYIGANQTRYWLRAGATGTDLVPIGPTGQAAPAAKPITVSKGAIVVMPDGRVISNTGVGGVAGNTVVKPGETIIGPGGNVLGASPSAPSVLGRGQMQVGPNGQVQAMNPAISPEEIALKQQELNQQYQALMAEAQRRWQADRDDNAYKIAVASADAWYKNEALRNTRLVEAQRAAVQDRQMQQPMMGPRDTVILPGNMVGSAFSGQWGPAYSDTEPWGQYPDIQKGVTAAGGGATSEWPTVLQPGSFPAIQGQQPMSAGAGVPGLSAAGVNGPQALPAGGGNQWPTADPNSVAPPIYDQARDRTGLDYPGNRPVDLSGATRTPEGTWQYPGSVDAAALIEQRDRQARIDSGLGAGGIGPTRGGDATPVSKQVQQHPDGLWWEETTWSDGQKSYAQAGDPTAGDAGMGGGALGPPSRFFPQGTPQGPGGGPSGPSRFTTPPAQPTAPGMTGVDPSQWPVIGGLIGQMTSPATTPNIQPPIGYEVNQQLPANVQYQTQQPLTSTPVSSPGWSWDQLQQINQWRPFGGGGGEWDFGSGQGDAELEQLMAIGAGPQLGAPAMPPPGGSTSPVPPEAVMGSGNEFGQPVENEVPYHKGVDYQAQAGTPVQAPASGTVVFVGDRGELGLSVVIQDEAGQTHELNHLAGTDVQVGDPVQVGQPVGQVGDTGNTTGAHLDYRVRGQEGDFTNPEGLDGVGNVLGGMPNMEGMPAPGPGGNSAQMRNLPTGMDMEEQMLGAGQGEGWGYGPPLQNPWQMSEGMLDVSPAEGGWANRDVGMGGGDSWSVLGSGQGEGEEVMYFADSGHVIKKTMWGGDESTAVYEDTGMGTAAPDGTASNSPQDLAATGQPGVQQAAAAQPSPAGTTYQTKNGPRTEQQMRDELMAAGWGGQGSVIDAYARTTGGTVTGGGTSAAATQPGTTNPAASQGARGPARREVVGGWEFIYDADGKLISYRPSFDPSQINAQGEWGMKGQESAQQHAMALGAQGNAAAQELARINAGASRDVAGITGRSNVLATWGRTAAGSPWISRLTGRSPAPGDMGSPEASSSGFGWPPQQSQQSAGLLQNITGPAQSPTSGGWQDAVPGATSSAQTPRQLGWDELVGQGGGEWDVGSGQGEDDASSRIASGLGAGGLGMTRMPQISQWDNLIRQHAGEYQDDPRFIRTVAAGARAESSDNPRAYQHGYRADDPRTHQQYGGRGLWQFDIGPTGMGAGVPEEQLFDPAYQASRIVPEYANAYRQSLARQMPDEQRAAEVYGAAERPGGTYGGRWQSTKAPAYGNYTRAYNELGSGQGDDDFGFEPWQGGGANSRNVGQQFEGMESGWPSPPSAEEFTNLGPFGQTGLRYGMESAGVPWRPWADAMLGAWRQTNQQAPTGLSGWAPRNVSQLGMDVATPSSRAQMSNEAELFMPTQDWMEKQQRRWQPQQARTTYAA